MYVDVQSECVEKQVFSQCIVSDNYSPTLSLPGRFQYSRNGGGGSGGRTDHTGFTGFYRRPRPLHLPQDEK